ncbi:unnamed protein product [Mytilus coruscus]|uniref:Uncharacterized protein n=1 Tax=Mytilus coruscus TaxID=42192 RepID=A0A6J8F5C5_MYTCO|nr:unnamed protein product [Mytilus coruscus]
MLIYPENLLDKAGNSTYDGPFAVASLTIAHLAILRDPAGVHTPAPYFNLLTDEREISSTKFDNNFSSIDRDNSKDCKFASTNELVLTESDVTDGHNTELVKKIRLKIRIDHKQGDEKEIVKANKYIKLNQPKRITEEEHIAKTNNCNIFVIRIRCLPSDGRRKRDSVSI